MSLNIDCAFDSGNIERLDSAVDGVVNLAIRKDASSDFLQWFHFRASGLKGQTCRFNIVNAGDTTYPQGWDGFDVVTSSDRHFWYRTPTQYDGKCLSWEVHQAETDALWFAYFAPYSTHQHTDLIAAAATAEGVEYRSLASTHLGRSIDYLRVTALRQETANDPVNSARRQLWVIARQHPGESMAGWWMEGWLDRLLDHHDATSCALRALVDIHIVPNMNPDGTFLGHLRTNALGVNLNREWQDPSIEKSPEVFYVRQLMESTGVDLALDVHGDEALPYNFIAGTEGVRGWNEQRNAELQGVKETWAAINPDFQTVHGYPKTSPGSANLSICSNYLADRFGCLAMTLEMPFKDTADTPRVNSGWSPERSMRLGSSFVDVAYLALTKRLLGG